MIHEIMHTLGFVPTCAPHHTLAGHVSDDPRDLMYAGSAPWQPSILDVNHDDYYGANVPGCLNFAQSPYLTSSHGVSVVVNGPGTVTSSPAGIACPVSCAATFDGPVTLTATPAAGAAFDGWSGACTGTGACTVTGDATVTALFSAFATLTVTVEGKGSVAGGGIACPPTCTAALRAGTSVTLEATPATGYAFAGWAGPCSGKGSCTLTLTGDTGVTAAFVARPHRRALTFAVRARQGRGLLRASDGYEPCARRVPILVERRTGRGWSAVRRGRTNDAGKFAVVLPRGVARARAPQVVVGGQTCLAAVSRSVRAR